VARDSQPNGTQTLRTGLHSYHLAQPASPADLVHPNRTKMVEFNGILENNNENRMD